MFPFSRHVCARKLSEIGCARCGAPGFVAGTKLRVRGGWRAVETLCAEDHLHLFPQGDAPAVALSQEAIWIDPFDCPAVVRPLQVPPGALGNDCAFLLQQDMRVLMHDPAARAAFGTAHVTVRGGDLIGFCGIAPGTPPIRAALVGISFAAEQLVMVAGGTWVLCPPQTRALDALTGPDAVSVFSGHKVRHLTAEEADVFLAAQECRVVRKGDLPRRDDLAG